MSGCTRFCRDRHGENTLNLAQLFDLSLLGRRDTPALEYQGVTYTFGDIDARSNRRAQLLAQRGLHPGDRLCVFLANCIEMIDLYLACVKLGVIFVPINILYRDREITHILGDADPTAVVSSSEFASPVPIWNPADLTCAAAALPDERPIAPLDGDAPAGIIYTSGTTGTSKGAVLTHNNFAANAMNLTACWQITSADRFLLALPLFHVHGLGNGLPTWLVRGCLMRLLERFPPDAVLRCSGHLRSAPRYPSRPGPSDRRGHAAVRIWLRSPTRASLRRIPRALRPHHPRALRHERDHHEP